VHPRADRATPEGRKELVGFTRWRSRERAGLARSACSTLKRRGLDVPPRLVIAEGALGFWKAAGERLAENARAALLGDKTANVLAKLPKSQQPKPNARSGDLDGRNQGRCELAFDAFIESYTPKYEKAAIA